MAHRIPTARDGVLRDLNTNGSLAETIFIGMAEWYTWLEYHRSFCFETDCTAFTVRKEQRPGGWYWYAYRRKNGKLHSAYLGRSEELTLDRLNTIAAVLERVKTHEITDPKNTIHAHLESKNDFSQIHPTSIITLQVTSAKTEQITMPEEALKYSSKTLRAVDISLLPSPAPFDLTRREHEVLCLLTMGLTSAQIAERLVISLSTVNTHVRSIYNKLEVTSRSSATRLAVEHHLV